MYNTTNIFDLASGLDINRYVVLEEKYRYDFVSIDPISASSTFIFVFRTIKGGRGKNNVLIDMLFKSNIDIFAAKKHNDCHFHLFNIKDILTREEIFIGDSIILKVIKTEISDLCYAIFLNQKYRINNRECECKTTGFIGKSDINCLLFTVY